LALCAALLVAVQVSLAFLPNIELVSLLVMLFTMTFGWRVLWIIYAFVMVEGLIFGFHIWWISWLYTWTVLAGLTWLFRNIRSHQFYAALSGAFGLAFGALCSIPYLFVGGPAAMIGYWVAGIPFDLLHGAGNFALCLFLWEPLYGLLCKLREES